MEPVSMILKRLEERRLRALRRWAKREAKIANYRETERQRVRASLEASGLSTNVYEWETSNGA